MSELKKEAAYIKGLFDGMKLDSEKGETKIISHIIAYLEKAAEEVEMLDSEQGFLADRIDELDDVIEVLADEIEDYDDFEDDLYQLKCDNCGAVIEFTDDDLDAVLGGSFECPECGEIIELDLSALDDECGCGCDHDHED